MRSIIHILLRCCSAYGDALFLVIQTVIMAALVLYYSGRAGAAAAYCAVYAVILGFLMTPAAPERVIAFLYATNMPNIALARVSGANNGCEYYSNLDLHVLHLR